MAPPYPCPSCDGVLVNHAAAAPPFDVAPQMGDVSVCAVCWAILEMTDCAWRMLTLREFEALPEYARHEVLDTIGELGRMKGLRPSMRFAHDPH